MRGSTSFVLAVTASLAAACSMRSGAGADDGHVVATPQGTPAAQRVHVTNDPAALASRLHVDPHAVGLRTQALHTLDLGGAGAPAPPTIEWVGKLDPPEAIAEIAHTGGVAGPQPTEPQPLLAATVTITGNVALVTYLLTNDYFAGAVDVLDITNIDAPVLKSSAIFEHMNITSAAFAPDDGASGSGTVYVSASTCDPEYVGTALLEKLRLDHFQLDVAADYRMPLFGGSGESVALAGDRVFGTAGLHGGLRVFEAKTGKVLGEAAVDNPGGDARWVSVEGGLAAVVSGGAAGRLDVFDATSLAQLGSYPFDGANIPASKSTVELVGGRAFVAAGPGGVQVLGAKTGKLLGAIPVPQATGYAPEDVVTNAVSVDRDLVFIANGGPGVYVARASAPIAQGDSEAPFDVAWTTALDITGSVNHVVYRGDALLVASGASGLQILHIE